MTKLSVNINKIATLRNARGGNVPDVVKVALDCESFGADGITVHPRPDERHIRRSDVYDLRPLLRTEFNIEGYPSPEFIDLVLKVKPHQDKIYKFRMWIFQLVIKFFSPRNYRKQIIAWLFLWQWSKVRACT